MDRRDVIGLLGASFLPFLRGDPHEVIRRAWAADAPALLTQQQRRTLVVLSDLIIPPTDTPGAAGAGVPAFIERVVDEWYLPADRDRFVSGLASLEGARFAAMAERAQLARLRTLERAHDPFFAQVKGLTLVGYYTSEIGITRELREPFMPGRYDGSVPVGRG